MTTQWTLYPQTANHWSGAALVRESPPARDNWMPKGVFSQLYFKFKFQFSAFTLTSPLFLPPTCRPQSFNDDFFYFLQNRILHVFLTNIVKYWISPYMNISRGGVTVSAFVRHWDTAQRLIPVCSVVIALDKSLTAAPPSLRVQFAISQLEGSCGCLGSVRLTRDGFWPNSGLKPVG